MFKISFILLNYFYCVNCNSDLFLIHNYDKGEYYCVTNSSDAITWIDEDGANQSSESISSYPNKNIKFGLEGYELRNDTKIFGKILDRRWEEIGVIKTLPATAKREKLSYIRLDPNIIDIRLPFSIRTDKEAHLFLCDGDVITKANCYWLLLGVRNGTTVALRKCSKGEISYNESENQCVTNLIENSSESLVSSKFWTHFEFYIHEKRRIYFQKVGAVRQALLRFDEDNTLTVYSVFLHSKEVPGLWKIHFYKDYLPIPKRENIQLEPVINVVDHKICIKFFAFMCENCTLKVILRDANNVSNEIKELIYSTKKEEAGVDFFEWVEIKFFANNIATDKVVLFISTTGTSDGWWRIHKIGLCQENEYRMIMSKSNLNCQLISSKQTYNFNENKDVVVENPSNCPPNTLGFSCVPCPGDCGRSKICENFDNNEVKCTCSKIFEIPELLNITANTDSVRIVLSCIDCSKVCGSLNELFLNITATCLNEWCRSISKSFTYNFPESVYNFENLQPFSNYSLNITLCQNVTCYNVTSTKFQTKPNIPKPVDLSVYMKNTSSVSFRWLTPDPPTGVIESLTIRYGICGKDSQEIRISVMPCQIWPDYNCFTITDLEKSQNYCFTAIVKNQNVEYLKEAEEISTLTDLEQSSAPYDLNFKWSIDNNLTLKWKHPNQTNGEIKYFRIVMDPQPLDVNYFYSNFFTVMHGNYQLVYQYNIKQEVIKPSTQYTVRIAAHDGIRDGKVLSGEFISPPSIPGTVNGPTISVRDFKIMIFVSLNCTQKIFLFASNNNDSKYELSPELEKFENEFHLLPKYGIVCECELCNFRSFTFIVGDKNSVCNESYYNPPLLPNTGYNITILLVNTFRNISSYKILSYTVSTESHSMHSPEFYLLVVGLPLFTILAISCVYLLFKKKIVLSEFFKRKQVAPQNIILNDIEVLRVRIDIESFEKYVMDSLKNGTFLNQHQIILQGHSRHKYDELYKTFTYDYLPTHSEKIFDIPSKAYIIINKLQIEFYKDFWKMIWEENVENSIFINSEFFDQSERYWPEENTEIDFENFSVQLISSQEFRYYKLRTFKLLCQNRIAYFNQFHLSSVSLNILPKSVSAFVPFFKKMSKILLKSTPILVHSCSGMAETGFILLCDICIRTAKDRGVFDVTHVAQVLGNCRIELIEDRTYFILAHLVILELLLNKDTKFKTQSDSIRKEEILEQMRHMNRMVLLDESLRKIKLEACLTPAFSIYENESTEYMVDNISTCLLDCFGKLKKVITTHLPNYTNLNYFWNMLQEHNVSVIVSLNEAPLAEGIWLPSQHKPILTFPNLHTTHKTTKIFQGFSWTTLRLETPFRTDTVETFSFTSWEPKVNCPNDLSEFVKFCMEIQSVLKKFDSILIMCRDGITATGIFVANLLNIEMITTEEAYDVCSAARAVKIYNTNFIKDEEQFLFLWKVAENCLTENQLYEKL